MESPPEVSAAATTEAPRSLGALIALAGAALVIVSTMLPWKLLEGQEGRIVTTGLTGGDGWIAIVLAIVLASLALRNRLDPEAGITGVLVVTALLGLMTAFEIIDIRSKELAAGVTLSIGYGIWLMAAGVALSIFGIIRMRAG